MHRKTGLSPPVIITDRPKAVHSLRFHMFYVRCFQFLNVLILTLLCVLLFNLVKLNELPPVWERAANSAYHLFFRCLLKYVCSSFPLMFRTSFGFWFGQFLKYLY